MNGEEGRVCRGHASLNIGVNKHPLYLEKMTIERVTIYDIMLIPKATSYKYSHLSSNFLPFYCLEFMSPNLIQSRIHESHVKTC